MKQILQVYFLALFSKLGTSGAESYESRVKRLTIVIGSSGLSFRLLT